MHLSKIFNVAKYSDFRVIVGEHVLHLHKAVLAEESKYFAALFAAENSAEMQRSEVHFDKSGFDESVIIGVLKMIYEMRPDFYDTMEHSSLLGKYIRFADYLGAANCLDILFEFLRDLHNHRTGALRNAAIVSINRQNDKYLSIVAKIIYQHLDITVDHVLPACAEHLFEIMERFPRKLTEQDKFMLYYRLYESIDNYEELLSTVDLSKLYIGALRQLKSLKGVRNSPVIMARITAAIKNKSARDGPVCTVSKIVIRENLTEKKN